MEDRRFIAFSPHPDPRLRLFCFPNAGSGVAVLHGWLRDLAPDVQLCPVQLPGRENRRMEQPFTRITPLVTAVADALKTYLDLPFAFFGHSLGALIAFELSREFRRRGVSLPRHLFVSSRPAPQIQRSGPALHQLSESAMIAELCTRYNAIPAVIMNDTELMKVFVPVLRADLEIIETYGYEPEPPLDCPISAFGGMSDLMVTRDDLEAWREQTSGSFNLQMFPGDHFFPKNAREPFLQAIRGRLRTVLEDA